MMLFYFTSEANSIAIDNGYSLTEGQGYMAKCRRHNWMDLNCLTLATLKPKLTKFIKEKSNCREKSIWEIIEPTFSSTVVEACGDRGCTPNALPNKTLGYCINWKDFDCSMTHLKNTLAFDKHAKKVPCEKLEYSGYHIASWFNSEENVSINALLGGKDSDKRIFIGGFSFNPPYTMSLQEEYYIVPTLDLIGIIGGTLGMFIGFSFYGTYTDIIDIIQSLASRINYRGKYWKKYCFDHFIWVSFIFTVIKAKLNTSHMKVVKDVADWLVFLLLGILAIASAKGSLDSFSNEKTSWTIEQRPIPYQPTFIMCFKLSVKVTYLGYHLDLGKDFTMSLKISPERYSSN